MVEHDPCPSLVGMDVVEGQFSVGENLVDGMESFFGNGVLVFDKIIVTWWLTC